MLDVSRVGDIAVLTMRHGKANAMDVELCRHITSRLEELGTSSARAVVITGREEIFSAGVEKQMHVRIDQPRQKCEIA